MIRVCCLHCPGTLFILDNLTGIACPIHIQYPIKRYRTKGHHSHFSEESRTTSIDIVCIARQKELNHKGLRVKLTLWIVLYEYTFLTLRFKEVQQKEDKSSEETVIFFLKEN